MNREHLVVPGSLIFTLIDNNHYPAAWRER